MATSRESLAKPVKSVKTTSEGPGRFATYTPAEIASLICAVVRAGGECAEFSRVIRD